MTDTVLIGQFADLFSGRLDCYGSDGNGYYGTGWWLSVSPKTASDA